MYALIGVAFTVFFFLGWAQSHWIAPAVLFVTSAPLILEAMWSALPLELAAALLGALGIYYAAFALGRLAGGRRAI